MNRTVWTFADADIQVFLEDSSGNVADPSTPLFTYCYAESGQVSATTPIARRAVTGRGRRKILQPANYYDDVKLQLDALFLRKSQEIDLVNVFAPTKQLRLVVKFSKLEYSGVVPFENDSLTLSYCFANSFVVSGQQADIVKVTAAFEAEKLF